MVRSTIFGGVHARVSAWGTLGLLTLGFAACDHGYPPSEWVDPAYDHAALSGGFLLLGTHTDAPCTSCHVPGNYAPLFQAAGGSDCQACHEDEYRVRHGPMGYPRLCTLCHTPTVWSDGAFDHAASSGGIGLLGVHSSVPCTACHYPETFEPLFEPEGDTDCVTCHQGVFPAWHSRSGFPDQCVACHSPTAWADGAFDHLTQSGTFALLGIHRDLPCTFCHSAGNMDPVYDPGDAEDCVVCHQSIYLAVHEGTGYPNTCFDCHTPTSWKDGEFNHSAISGGFELLGAHGALACTACHDPETFEPEADPADTDDCQACHQGDYDGQHGGSGYPTECTLCHTPSDWSREGFDHAEVSGGFEFLGDHGALPCTACHDPETFDPVADPLDAYDCLACHQGDYDGHHGGSGYPTQCTLCHTPSSWSRESLDHVTVSGGFQLLGVHDAIQCTACHDPATFQALFSPEDENDCLACHQADYQGQHGNDGYPTDCTLCHTPTVWSAGTFDHRVASGGFGLLGVHESLPCTACHDPLTFQPLFTPSSDTDCVSCHQAEYDGEHGGSGYPTDCTLCHTPTIWSAVDFDHDADYFPIFTGEHAPRWSTCATCHVDPDNFADFTCFQCHAHRQTAMDARHSGEAGYVYVSSACLGCHPAGEA